MKIKRFVAKDMRTALAEVKEFLGPDAIILSNKKVAGGIELVAAVDPEARPGKAPVAEELQKPVAATTGSQLNIRVDDDEPEQEAPADSLRALLARPDDQTTKSACRTGRCKRQKIDCKSDR